MAKLVANGAWIGASLKSGDGPRLALVRLVQQQGIPMALFEIPGSAPQRLQPEAEQHLHGLLNERYTVADITAAIAHYGDTAYQQHHRQSRFGDVEQIAPEPVAQDWGPANRPTEPGAASREALSQLPGSPQDQNWSVWLMTDEQTRDDATVLPFEGDDRVFATAQRFRSTREHHLYARRSADDFVTNISISDNTHYADDLGDVAVRADFRCRGENRALMQLDLVDGNAKHPIRDRDLLEIWRAAGDFDPTHDQLRTLGRITQAVALGQASAPIVEQVRHTAALLRGDIQPPQPGGLTKPPAIGPGGSSAQQSDDASVYRPPPPKLG